ncbi:MAG: T9SS type A sorting domain-containing protein [Bacteroidales bacterium]|nr:T9SS type A sorting domain-containing protein [Bacteroidales bacterium]
MKKTLLLVTMAVFTLTAAFAQDTLYVKPDDSSTAWADRTGVFTNLQDALDAALGGDQIWVAGGTYLPSIKFPNGSEDRCKSFVLKSDVALYGGFAGTESAPSEREMSDSLFVFANATILSGDINATPDDQTDNSYHVVYAATASNFILDGFTITGGYGNRQGYNNEQRGAGLYMGGNSESNHSTNSTVRYCTFMENTANQNGGAAYAPYTNRFESCFFNNNSVLATNSGGGALFFDHCTYLDTVAVNCCFYNNKCLATATPTTSQRYGGGAVSCGSNCTFCHCTFFHNSSNNAGGAVYFGNGNLFHYCLFIGNTGGLGGALYGGAATSLLANNEASQTGGAIYTTGSASRSVNSTFVNHKAIDNTVIYGSSGFTFFNCISWNNGTDPANLFNEDINCQYSAVEGVFMSGDGNINMTTSDFDFRNPFTSVGWIDTPDASAAMLSADYSIGGSSLCRNAGSTNILSLSGYHFPETDLAGNPRTNGAQIDIGCYENQCDETPFTYTITALDTVFDENVPGTGILHLQISIDNIQEGDEYSIMLQNSDHIEPMPNGIYTFGLDFPDMLTFIITRRNGDCSMSIEETLDTYNDSIFNTGIAEHRLDNVLVFPNPSSDFVTVQCAGVSPSGEWQLFDLNGRCVMRLPVVSETMTLNLTVRPAGMYLLRRVSADGKMLGTAHIVKIEN